MSSCKESSLYLRGLFLTLTDNYALVYYDRKKRFDGKSKYTYKKMVSLALDGVTSFSGKPLRLATITGFSVFAISLFLTAWAFIAYLSGITVPGWASNVISIYILGGIQLVFLGILGEYIGKIYIEVKERPRYLIEERL